MQNLGELESLAESLKTQLQEENTKVIATVKREFQSLSANLSELGKEELISMSGDMAKAHKSLQTSWLRTWTLPLASGLAIITGLSLGSWGLAEYLGSRIEASLKELSHLEARLSESREALRELESKTWGISLHRSKEGRFLILPKGMKANTGWAVGKRQAIKLED